MATWDGEPRWKELELAVTREGHTFQTEHEELVLEPAGLPSLEWCAHCTREVLTQVRLVNSSKTFWSAVGVLLLGGVLGCFLLPYCTDSCKAVQKTCVHCGHMIS